MEDMNNKHLYSGYSSYVLDEQEDDELDEEEIMEIQQALENVKEGRVKPIEQVAKELRVILRQDIFN